MRKIDNNKYIYSSLAAEAQLKRTRIGSIGNIFGFCMLSLVHISLIIDLFFGLSSIILPDTKGIIVERTDAIVTYEFTYKNRGYKVVNSAKNNLGLISSAMKVGDIGDRIDVRVNALNPRKSFWVEKMDNTLSKIGYLILYGVWLVSYFSVFIKMRRNIFRVLNLLYFILMFV